MKLLLGYDGILRDETKTAFYVDNGKLIKEVWGQQTECDPNEEITGLLKTQRFIYKEIKFHEKDADKVVKGSAYDLSCRRYIAISTTIQNIVNHFEMVEYLASGATKIAKIFATSREAAEQKANKHGMTLHAQQL